MAKLFSHHDPRRLHASLGCLALCSFMLRLCFLFRFGTSFPAWEPQMFALLTVSIHLWLHLSSFIPPLPPKRILHSPMIWTEFRLHNAVFGCRHVFATLTALALRGRKENSEAFMVAWIMCLVLGSASLASVISARYGDHKKRTTNSMAYPATVSNEKVQKTRAWYANAQFAATFFCMSLSPTCAFWPLLAIELAPLMMTLVRKGIATTAAYHRVYSLALLMPYLVYALVLTTHLNGSVPEAEYLSSFFALGAFPSVFAPRLRRLGLPKHAALALFLLAFVAARQIDKVPTSLTWLLLLGTVAGVVSTPFNETKWMFANYTKESP